MCDVIVRPMTTSDAEAVGRMFFRLVGSGEGADAAYTEYVRGAFGLGSYFSAESVLVAEVDGEVVGICARFREPCVVPPVPDCLSVGRREVEEGLSGVEETVAWGCDWAGEGGVYVSSLFVEEEFRCRGVGSALMSEAVAGACRAKLLCRADNDAAFDMYVGLGFRGAGLTFVMPEGDDDDAPLQAVCMMVLEPSDDDDVLSKK